MVSKAAQAAVQQRAAAALMAATEQKQRRFSNVKLLQQCSANAKAKVNEMAGCSKLFSEEHLETIPKFSLDEMQLGKVLGKGGFGTVNEILGFQCKPGSDDPAAADGKGSEARDQELQDKKFIAEHCIREGGDARYAIKALSPETKNDPESFTQGTIDLAVETMFLSVVSHPHIITMRAFGASGMLGPDYFIVLDRLYDTLEARIPKWRTEKKKGSSMMNKLRGKSNEILGELMEIKLSYAYDLMGAIEYLHKNNLIYRDLKPENVGFNVRDDIVLFDFGLAREVHDKDRLTDHTWKLTGETGSLRYMAPEVASNKPYGYTADIYSFGVMLWEILNTQKPYSGYNKKMHSELVVQNGGRPKIDDKWNPSLKGFLNACWHQDLAKRPSAARASNILKREVAKAMGDDDAGLNNFRRKSTFVNRDSLREKKRMSAKLPGQ